MRTLLMVTVVVLSGCGMNKEVIPGNCDEKLLCPPGNSCVNNFCVAVDDGGLPLDGGAGDTAGDTGSPPSDAAGSCSLDIHCPAATPACVANRCVACRDNAQCAGSPTTPFCVANACVGCAAAPVNACALKSATTPACGPSGACVECTASSTSACGGAKPTCGEANTCVACTSDAQCAGKPSANAPGICMAHEDGRCATTEETVVVQDGDLQAAINAAVGAGKKLILVSSSASFGSYQGPGRLSIIGRGVTPPDIGGSTTKPALAVSGGELYLRGVTLTASKGGLLVDGGTVDVVSVTVQQNLSALVASDVAWGGIRVQSVASGKTARFRNVSILNNSGPGMTCSVAVEGQGVLASGNNSLDLGTTCGLVNCLQPSTTCGAGGK